MGHQLLLQEPCQSEESPEIQAFEKTLCENLTQGSFLLIKIIKLFFLFYKSILLRL